MPRLKSINFYQNKPKTIAVGAQNDLGGQQTFARKMT